MFQVTTAAKRRLNVFEKALHSIHQAPERSLGNLKRPLSEAVFIILTFQTDVERARLTWRALRRKFPTWNDVCTATPTQVARVLQPGGLHNQKAVTIQWLLNKVKDDTGAFSLEFLREQTTDDAERYLLGLPGLSWKGARCVLLYSLDRQVLPIDVNAFRVLRRTGFLSTDDVYRRKTLHDRLQDSVPPAKRRRFHVNMVIHGQRLCTPASPSCSACGFQAKCPSGQALAGARHPATN